MIQIMRHDAHANADNNGKNTMVIKYGQATVHPECGTIIVLRGMTVG